MVEIIGVDVWKMTIPRVRPFSIALGRIDLPGTPGHGAEIDPAFLARMETFSVTRGT